MDEDEDLCVDYLGMHETLGRRRQEVHEGSDQYELSSSMMEEEGDRFLAINTQPNDQSLLVRYAEEGGDAALLRSVEEADDSDLVEIDKEQFCPKPNPRKEKPRAVIRIGKEHLTEKRARTANVGEGDRGVVKRAFVHVHAGQLRRMMSSGKDRLVRNRKKVQVLVPIYNLKAKERIGDEGRDKKCVVIEDEPDHSQIRTRERAECSVKFERIDEGGSEMDQSVEILDIAPLVERGLVSPFVSSKKFHTSMMEGESESPGGEGPTASDVFRAEVLRILRKPFDKEEYKKLREAIKVGSYFDHHQDLKRKLKASRHKRGKCLVILRGFFYWLQNLTREGAFQPWTDRECLAVEPPPLS